MKKFLIMLYISATSSALAMSNNQKQDLYDLSLRILPSEIQQQREFMHVFQQHLQGKSLHQQLLTMQKNEKIQLFDGIDNVLKQLGSIPRGLHINKDNQRLTFKIDEDIENLSEPKEKLQQCVFYTCLLLQVTLNKQEKKFATTYTDQFDLQSLNQEFKDLLADEELAQTATPWWCTLL